MTYTAKDPCPPTEFSVPNITKSWKCEGEGEERGEEENVHLLTHTTTRGVGKKLLNN